MTGYRHIGLRFYKKLLTARQPVRWHTTKGYMVDSCLPKDGDILDQQLAPNARG